MELVSNKKQRERLVERMSKEVVSDVIAQLLARLDVPTSEVVIKNDYIVLRDLAAEYLEDFAYIMGVGIEYQQAQASVVGVQGIRTIMPNYPMYPYQDEITTAIAKLVASDDKRRCLLHLPTGAGKTRVAMNVVATHLRNNDGALVLWLADTSELCTQAACEFERSWQSLGNRELKAYSYFADTDISLGGIDSGLLIAGLQKLNSVRKSDLTILYKQLMKFVTLIVFDEAHKAIAPTYEAIVQDMLSNTSGTNTFFVGVKCNTRAKNTGWRRRRSPINIFL